MQVGIFSGRLMAITDVLWSTHAHLQVHGSGQGTALAGHVGQVLPVGACAQSVSSRVVATSATAAPSHLATLIVTTS